MNSVAKILDYDTLYQMYIVDGMAMHEIAEDLGVAVGSVYNHLCKNGIPGRKHFTDAQRKKISRSQTGKHHPGVPCSEETKQKLRAAHIGVYTKPSKYGGHTKLRSDGYVEVYIPDHPHASKDGYVMEHILVMEDHIGRHLNDDEIVHHVNHIRNDNRIDNLRLMTRKEHMSLHMKERHATGSISYRTIGVKVVETGEQFDSETDLAKRLGVKTSTVSRAIKHGYSLHGIHVEKI